MDPNLNPRIFPPHHHNHHHHTTVTPPPPPPPPPDLHTTLSTLKNLIHQSKSTITSLTTTLTPTPTPTTATCPFTPHHHLPPPSLFRHHLTCPNSPARINLTNFHNNSNFFYRNCPSVVTFQNQNNINPNLTLPNTLLSDSDIDSVIENDNINEKLNLLPSDLFNVRIEITKWNDFPSSYSFSVIRSIIHCYINITNTNKKGLTEWILTNSSFYGVVIDVSVTDHIFLLVRVCLKAIAREAVGYFVSVTVLESGESRFRCPVLVEVFSWLGVQLGVLYGEVNGKLFSISILKQALLIGLSECLFSFDEVNVKTVREKDGRETGMVLASQIEEAVAALRDRFVLETRIRALRDSRFVPAYQRVQEHEYLSKKANEVRSKRSDYRPIIEHDGVLWHRGGNQDGNKNKSREELLAEERDYKRRRMSYRGKKMKRSTTQVTRDIIDEYMEEIKHANLASEPFTKSDVDANNEKRTVTPNSSKSNKMVPQSHPKETVSDISMKSTRSEDEIKEKSKEKRRDGHRGSSRSNDHEHRDEQKRSRRYHFSSPDRGHSRSRDNHKRSIHEDKRSSSVVSSEFEDRYDPSKSRNMDDDDEI